MFLRSTLLPLSVACAAALMPLAAMAQSTGCDGKNLLDELKSKDAAAFQRIQDAASAAKNGKALLWKIESEEKPDNPASYLFGTLDVSDERLHKLSAAVDDALNHTSRIALEVDETSPERTQEALAAMRTALLPDAKAKFSTLLAQPDAERANLMLAKSGLPADMQPRIKPWVATLLTSQSDCEMQRRKHGKLSLQQELARQAENRGVGSFGLESTEMQYSAFAEVPDADQVSLLKASLAGHERIDDMTEAQVLLYLAHDVGALWPLQSEIGKRFGADAKALEAYRQSVIDGRNIRMRDRTLMHLSSGGIFIAVGAMQLPGDSGLVELIRNSGYKLTAVE